MSSSFMKTFILLYISFSKNSVTIRQQRYWPVFVWFSFIICHKYEDARLRKRQRIVPCEECRKQKNSRSAAESVSVSVRFKNIVPSFSHLQGRNYSSHCSFSQSGGALHLDLFGQFVFGLCLMWKVIVEGECFLCSCLYSTVNNFIVLEHIELANQNQNL